ncbi:MAG: ATP-binding cassette domain-containing protein [Pseudomonadota bacterium]
MPHTLSEKIGTALSSVPKASNSQDFKRPSGLLTPLRQVLMPAFIFSCMINLLTATGPLFMLQVVDRVLPTGNLSTLIALITIAAIALAVMAALDYVRAVLLMKAANWWERRTSRSLMPLAARSGVGAARTAANISRIAAHLGGSTAQVLFDAPWIFVFIGVAFLLHPWLAWLGVIIALTLIALAFFGHVSGRSRLQEALATRRQADGLTGHLDRNTGLLATMGLAQNLRHLHRDLLEETHNCAEPPQEQDQARRAFAKYLRAMLQILTLGMGAWLVVRGELSGGAMVASSILLSRALAPVEQLTGLLPALVEARAALNSLEEVSSFRDNQSVRSTLPAPKGELTFENITVPAGMGQPPRLHQINVKLEPGSCVAIMGSSGAGKSTLAELAAGAATPAIGAVRLDGSDLRHWPECQRSLLVGYVPQRPTLFPGTISENIARFLPNAERSEVTQAAIAAGIHSLISRLPDGYETQMQFDKGPLSGGERQRLALARALFKQPRVLVLDEPNASLDREGERALISALSHLKIQGVTVIMAAHRAGMLSLADKIMLLDEGRVRDFGPRGEVIARMNARSRQIDLKRAPEEMPRLEDWIATHFKRESDGEARANAAMLATEMFNISLSAVGKSTSENDLAATTFSAVA